MKNNSDGILVLPFLDIAGPVPFSFKRFKVFLKNAFKPLLSAVKNREILMPNLPDV
jgi:hypothetical protein